MLILTRRVGESIIIGDDIIVTVLQEKCGRIRLGIAAPPGVRVDREEVRERISASGSAQSA
jgi:carbon storage regulator